MTLTDLDDVVKLEESVQDTPWTRGHFSDALIYGNEAWVLLGTDNRPCGFCVTLRVLDELEILNVAIRKNRQGQGRGLYMLQEVIRIACTAQIRALFLEVRKSNKAARRLYNKLGFLTVGLRKKYYADKAAEREDAIVMRLDL